MIQKIFTVYDSKSEVFLNPFYAPTRGSAIRSFTDACNKESHEFNRWSSDYTLFEIGTYDDSKAVIEMYDAKINLGLATEFLNKNGGV